MSKCPAYWHQTAYNFQAKECPACGISRHDEDMKIGIAKLAKTALDIQNASNLLAVVTEFRGALSALRAFLCLDLNRATETDVSNHFVTVLFMDKLASMTGYPQAIGNEAVLEAYKKASEALES